LHAYLVGLSVNASVFMSVVALC